MKSRTRKVQNQETDACETDEKLTSEEQQTKDAKKKKKKKRKLDRKEESAHTPTVEEKRCKKLKKKKEEEEEEEQEDQISEDIPDGDVEPEDLTPEEKRRLERKLKKVRSKERKQQKKQEEEEEKPVKVAEKKALEYLTRWSVMPKLWSFQKTRQTWLLQNMFDTEKLTDSHFETLLLYMEGLRGLARETTLKKAEDIVRSEEQTDAADAVRKIERAKQVAQLLCHA